MTTPEVLLAALEQAGPGHLAGLRRGLSEFTRGAWSRPEATLRRLLRSEGIPQFVMNHELIIDDGRSIGTPDAYFPQAAVAVPR